MCVFIWQAAAPSLIALPAEGISSGALPNLRDYLTASRFNQRRNQWWNRLAGNCTIFAVRFKGVRDQMREPAQIAGEFRSECGIQQHCGFACAGELCISGRRRPDYLWFWRSYRTLPVCTLTHYRIGSISTVLVNKVALGLQSLIEFDTSRSVRQIGLLSSRH